MHAQLLKFIADIRGSYWFIPSIMSLCAIAMSFVMTSLDGAYGTEWLRSIPWLYANQPDGARAVLSTIAGSMITVAGVTFSMTIVAVSFATGQLGPRLIRNFMQDTSNQVTLGTFIGTFIYCLLVLRTVRDSNGEAAGSMDAVAAFVPQLAILFGLASALVSVGVLIYFIHHVPESINVSNLTSSVGLKMDKMLDSLFPDQVGQPQSKGQDILTSLSLPDDFYAVSAAVDSEYDGYVEVLDDQKLLDIAKENDLIIRVEYRPGDFVTVGKSLVLVWPPDKIDDTIRMQCRRAFAFGIERTKTQNILFLVDQLVEIIARALSPGINDPFTAISCIDWLEAMLNKQVTRDSPSAFRADDSGKLRLVIYPVTFERTIDTIFDQILPYVCTDRIASMRLMKLIADIAISLPKDSEHLELLIKQAERLRDAAEQVMPLEGDRRAISSKYQQILKMLEDEHFKNKMRDSDSWLEGTA